VDAFDAEFFRFLQVVPQLGVEQQRLGRDAADVQAGAAEVAVFFDQGNLQSILAGANGGGVSGRAAADDGDVVGGFGQVGGPSLLMRTVYRTDDLGQTFDSSRVGDGGRGGNSLRSLGLCRVIGGPSTTRFHPQKARMKPLRSG